MLPYSATRPSGYGSEARAALHALEMAGWDPALRVLPAEPLRLRLPPKEANQLAKQRRRANRGHTMEIHHYVPFEAQPKRETECDVALTMFETESIPQDWLRALQERDFICVPSRFVRDRMTGAGLSPDKVRIVGQTFIPSCFDDCPTHAKTEAKGDFRFLSVFYFSDRKGWRQLVRAWCRAFCRDDSVRLVLKCRRTGWTARAVHELVSAELRRLGPRQKHAAIELRFGTSTPDVINRLLAGADAFVLPTRGEGWGRTIMEAVLWSLPVITSECGGQREYLDEGSAWLVPGSLTKVADVPDRPYGSYGGHLWFEADEDELADRMRSVLAYPKEAESRVLRARHILEERWSPEKWVRGLADSFADVLGGGPDG